MDIDRTTKRSERSATGEKFKEEFCGSRRHEREGGRLHPKKLFSVQVSERSTLKMKTPGDTGKSNYTTTIVQTVKDRLFSLCTSVTTIVIVLDGVTYI